MGSKTIREKMIYQANNPFDSHVPECFFDANKGMIGSKKYMLEKGKELIERANSIKLYNREDVYNKREELREKNKGDNTALRILAEKGDSESQHQYGDFIFKRAEEAEEFYKDNIKRDALYREAAEWYHKSALQYVMEAAYKYAEMHNKGQGVGLGSESDLYSRKVAARWYFRTRLIDYYSPVPTFDSSKEAKDANKRLFEMCELGYDRFFENMGYYVIYNCPLDRPDEYQIETNYE